MPRDNGVNAKRRVKNATFEIIFSKTSSTSEETPGEIWDRWDAMSNLCMREANFVMQRWSQWHLENGSSEQLMQWMDDLRTFNRTPKKERAKGAKKPSCPVGPQLQNSKVWEEIRKEADKRFPNLHGRVAGLTIKALEGALKKNQENSAFKKWQFVATFQTGVPSYHHSLPIRFDTKNSELIAPEGEDDNYKLLVRTTAFDQPGKSTRGSHVDTFEIISRSRKVRSYRVILDRLASGEYDFKGSFLHKKKNKWYVGICYEMPPKVKTHLDPERVAYLTPAPKGDEMCWYLWVPDKKNPEFMRRFFPGGNVHAVRVKRRNLVANRRSRQSNYKWHTSNARHGRKRATDNWTRFHSDWKDFVRTTNHRTTTEVIRICEEFNCGALAVYQPDGKRRDTRNLVCAGKVKEIRESTGWDWYQAVSMLQSKAQEFEITVSVKKVDGSPSPKPKLAEKVPSKPRKSPSGKAKKRKG